MEYAEWSFRAHKRRPDGANELDHTQSAERQMAVLGLKRRSKVDEFDLTEPEFPAGLGYLWLWFHELTLGLPLSGLSVPIITWESVDSWCRLMRTELEPWEVRVMMDLSQLRASVLLSNTKG